jgi:hypothetical protein
MFCKTIGNCCHFGAIFNTYIAQILYTIFHTAKHKGIPKWVKLVALVIHDTIEVAMDIRGTQSVTIVKHCISYSAQRGGESLSFPIKKKRKEK